MAKGFKRFQDHQNETSGEINISPLIDVVFILLIFFIVTTVFIDETGVEIEKPRAASQRGREITQGRRFTSRYTGGQKSRNAKNCRSA